MPLTFDSTSAGVVPAAEFLKLFPDRGRPVRLKHLGLTFYGLKDCLCMGGESQAIAPLMPGGNILCTFSESCPYLANEPGLAAIVTNGLNKAVPEVEEDEAAPLYPPGALNLWHWTCESLPKLLALESMGYTGKYIVPALTGTPDDSVIGESLAMFGIGPERLLPSGPLYRIKRLMLPQRLSGFHLPENMALCEFLRQRLMDAAGTLPGEKNLYIRRIGRRKIINEAELLSVLNDFSFEAVTPEDLTLAEDWRCMTNVNCSLMAHGANTALTLLQKPRSGLVELFSNRYASYTGLHAVRLLRLRYYPLVEELDLSTYAHVQTPAAEFIGEGLSADILVDPLHVRIALESILG